MLVVVVLLIILSRACGGGGQGGTGGSTTNSGSDAKEKAKQESKKDAPAAVEEPAPINLSGNGQMATEPFELESGLAIAEMGYQGDRNFIVQLLDQNGNQVGTGLANKIGAFQGSQAVKTKAGQHVLDVKASGPWTVTITQPRPSSAPDTASFSGDTKTTTDFFHLSSGLKRFNMTYQGDRNFIVQLLDKNGDPVGIGLANEVGSFDGSKAIQVPKDDVYLLQVEASGPWNIQVE